MRLPEINFVDDKTGKPVGINMYIGRRPIASFGNSNGDVQMLEWTTAGEGARLGMLVFHDDADREYAYGLPTDGLTLRHLFPGHHGRGQEKGWGDQHEERLETGVRRSEVSPVFVVIPHFANRINLTALLPA